MFFFINANWRNFAKILLCDTGTKKTRKKWKFKLQNISMSQWRWPIKVSPSKHVCTRRRRRHSHNANNQIIRHVFVIYIVYKLRFARKTHSICANRFTIDLNLIFLHVHSIFQRFWNDAMSLFCNWGIFMVKLGIHKPQAKFPVISTFHILKFNSQRLFAFFSVFVQAEIWKALVSGQRLAI